MNAIRKLYQDENNQAALRVTRDTNGNAIFVRTGMRKKKPEF